MIAGRESMTVASERPCRNGDVGKSLRGTRHFNFHMLLYIRKREGPDFFLPLIDSTIPNQVKAK
jgi:hypothetical protein